LVQDGQDFSLFLLSLGLAICTPSRRKEPITPKSIWFIHIPFNIHHMLKK
jgi:hypothetical protein